MPEPNCDRTKAEAHPDWVASLSQGHHKETDNYSHCYIHSVCDCGRNPENPYRTHTVTENM